MAIRFGNGFCVGCNSFGSSGFQWMTINSVTDSTASGIGQNGITVAVTQSGGGMGSTNGVFNPTAFPEQYGVPLSGTQIQNNNNGTFTATFSQPVTDALVAFASIGNGDLYVPIEVSAPFTPIFSTATTFQNPVNGTQYTQLTGNEGYAIIRIDGAVTTVTFNYTVSEGYCNVCFGFVNQNTLPTPTPTPTPTDIEPTPTPTPTDIEPTPTPTDIEPTPTPTLESRSGYYISATLCDAVTGGTQMTNSYFYVGGGQGPMCDASSGGGDEVTGLTAGTYYVYDVTNDKVREVTTFGGGSNFILNGSCSTPSCGGYTTYSVGDSAFGGIIGYILQSGDPGYDAIHQKGLVVTTIDYPASGLYGDKVEWGCFGSNISTDTVIGSGYQNTLNIIAGCGTSGTAAVIARAINDGGYSDWYLPSKDELNVILINRAIIGGWNGNDYWTSSQADNYYAWNQLQYENNITQNDQGTKQWSMLSFRAVRDFYVGPTPTPTPTSTETPTPTPTPTTAPLQAGEWVLGNNVGVADDSGKIALAQLVTYQSITDFNQLLNPLYYVYDPVMSATIHKVTLSIRKIDGAGNDQTTFLDQLIGNHTHVTFTQNSDYITFNCAATAWSFGSYFGNYEMSEYGTSPVGSYTVLSTSGTAFNRVDPITISITVI